MTQSLQSESTSDEIAISVKGLSKAYRIWRDPSARLKAPIWDAIGSSLPKAIKPQVVKARLSHEGKSRYYTDFFALNELDLEIKKGESVGIIGRNGSGKSTLLQMIAGTLSPTRGEVKVNGRVAALLELGSGFNPEFTGRENVFLNASILGLTKEEIDARLNEILEFADIGDFIEQPIKTYSSGMVVRLGFAVQTAVSPDILIVDEALAVGDEAFQRKCFSKIEQLQESKTTILFVSHDSNSIIQLCDRAILLQTGNVIKDGQPREVVKEYQRMIYNKNKQPQGRAERLTQPEPAQPSKPDENYDPNLISQTIQSYGEEICEIANWQILSETGENVNQLTPKRTYYIKYSVHFRKNAQDVRFGCSLKTTKGTMISGSFSHTKSKRLSHAHSGETFQVTFAFNCLVKPGVYFVSLGVFQQHKEEEVFAGRIVDAIILRVLTDDLVSRATEVVDLIRPIDNTPSEI